MRIMSRKKWNYVTGYSDWTLRALRGWRSRVRDVCKGTGPAVLKKKIFNPKFNLPKLVSYMGSAGEEFWGAFPKGKIRRGVSLVKAAALRRVAERVGCR